MNGVTGPGRVADEPYCYLTTIGRQSGSTHEVEMWFVHLDGSLYVVSGAGPMSDWVRNLQANARVTVRIAAQTGRFVARFSLTNPDERLEAATALAAKYRGHFGDPGEWVEKAYLIALDPLT